jgi:hypothetical protein
MKSLVSREAGRLLSRQSITNRASFSACRHFKSHSIPRQQPRRQFHNSPSLKIVKPYLLADIGEGAPAIGSLCPRFYTNIIRYHGMPGHTMVREARSTRRAIRSHMRSTVRQGFCGGIQHMCTGTEPSLNLGRSHRDLTAS